MYSALQGSPHAGEETPTPLKSIVNRVRFSCDCKIALLFYELYPQKSIGMILERTKEIVGCFHLRRHEDQSGRGDKATPDHHTMSRSAGVDLETSYS